MCRALAVPPASAPLGWPSGAGMKFFKICPLTSSLGLANYCLRCSSFDFFIFFLWLHMDAYAYSCNAMYKTIHTLNFRKNHEFTICCWLLRRASFSFLPAAHSQPCFSPWMTSLDMGFGYSTCHRNIFLLWTSTFFSLKPFKGAV